MFPKIRMRVSDIAMPGDSQKVIAEIHANCIYRTLNEMQLSDVELKNALGKILKELKSS